MAEEKLIGQKCVPCEGGTPPLMSRQIRGYIKQLSDGWEVIDGKNLKNRVKFKNFRESMVFVNQVANIAEEEDHHPDITINYNRVTIELTTHAIGGLSKNDFIVAAKIDKL